MSANICDVSNIKDEDVLRKMWQETEDFGRKKEIRAHMYKVREARLKDLYSSGTESQTQVSVQKTSSKSSNIQTSHADSLVDHSFASLKSKEVRDSASPTRDVAYNNKINATEKYGNTGWTITSSEDTSKDGKTHSAVRTATTSGSEKIDKGISNYAAKAEQKASVYQDGDANNFTRAVGMSDSSTIQQEASGGDEFSSFKSSSKTSKSSSKSVTESKSTSGDMVDYACPKDVCVREVRAGDEPSNAKTVVYTETKTLPDGSKVTTTRYETRGGSSKTTSSTSQSSTVQKLSSSTQQSGSTSSEQKSSSKYLTSSQDDSGIDTVDFKKAIKLSDDLAKNVKISSDHSTKSMTEQHQQDILKASKHTEVSSTTSKVLDTSNVQTRSQDIVDKQICEIKTSQPIEPIRKESTPPILAEVSPIREIKKSPLKEPYEQPERRKPFKPSKFEMEVASKATEGQYDTTYRAEFTNKKIHVEVSPTHDAFARSLRALTPDDLKQGSTRSLRNSNTSLRSSQSPEKMRHPAPDRLSSPKRYTSPDKCYEPRTTKKYSPEKFTSYNTDTITRRKKVTDDSASYRSSTLTRGSSFTKEVVKSRSRSASPTTTTSDFEYVTRRKSPQVTDLDDESSIIRKSTARSSKTVTETSDSRPTTLNYSRKSKKITERSPTSPMVDLVPFKRTPSPVKEVTTNIRRTSMKEEQQQRQEKTLRRSDTYEERCRQILGIAEKKKTERNVSDIINTDRRTYRTSSREKITQQEIAATTRKPSLPDAARRPSKSPEKAAPVNGYHDKKSPQISEFPSQIRRSPERKPLAKYPKRQSPLKDKPTISEFPSQIRKSPEKQPLEKYPERTSRKKEASKISEFPSQIRRTPEREPMPSYPDKQSPIREAPTICEFPSQIRKTPEKEPLQKYPEKKQPVTEAPKISEFPSQIRKTPEREPSQKLPERQSPPKEAPKISEFPSQIRKTPEREPLPAYPQRESPVREVPTISEFPSQIRRTPEREPLEKPSERKSPPKEAPRIAEFPSQIRKTPEREPLPEYPEKKVPAKEAPTICEFPSQIRKTPEREPLPQYPEKQKETKEPPKIAEFPSQVRKSPTRETTSTSAAENIVTTQQDVLTTKKKTKQLTEFPSQSTKKSPKPTAEDKVLQETTDYLYKDKIPVDEPLFTKKFIAELGSDDECEITVDEEGNTKINTIDDEELYLQEVQNVAHKTVKKDSPERQFVREKLSQERQGQTIKQQIDEFISIERNDIYRTTESRKSSPDLRRSPERGILKRTSQFDEKTQKAETSLKRSTASDKIKTTDAEETNKVLTVKAKQPKPTTSYTTTKKHLIRDSSDSKINITTTKTTTRETKEVKVQPKPILSKTPSSKSVTLRKTEAPTKCSKTCCDIKLETITKTASTDSKVTKKLIQQKPEQSVTPKRHTVTTTIHVSPVTTKDTTTRSIKNITNTQSVQTKPKTFTMPAKVAKPVSPTKKTNVENIEYTEVTQKKRIDKLVRTNSDQTARSPSKTPTRVTAKPDLNRKTSDIKDVKKCITTKTILINNTVADEREIIVDLLRSTSTRDDRNTVCPIPINKNNDIKGVPRYPDQVVEPDDYSTKHTPRKLSTIPIDEFEDVSDFTGVTEITTEDVIKEETTEDTADESLLSVNEKVSKFTHQKNKSKNLGPAPKVERPILIIDEKLESDECLLSVSEKVNKFVNKAERLSVGSIPERPRSPRCQNIVDITDLDENDDSLMSVSDKVTHFVTTAENVKKPQTSTIKVEKTDLSTVDESLRTDECLLSVSDKVNKFITTAETLKDDKKTTSTTKRPSKDSTEECITVETEERTYTRTSPLRQTTPKNIDRTSPTRHTSIKEERRNSRKDSSSTLTRKDSTTVTSVTTENETTPKTSRPSTARPALSGTIPLRSTESIRKAKTLFENMASGTENIEIRRQKDILSRPSVFDAKKRPDTITVRRVTPDRDDVKLKDIGIKESTSITSKTYDTRRKLSFPSSDDECKTTSTKTLLEKAQTSELDDLNDRKYYPRSSSPDNLDVPGYMKPLDRSLRPNSPHRASVTDIEESISKTTHTTILPEITTPASKFGVTLRRTDSGKNFTSTISSTTTSTSTATMERKKSLSSILKNHEIEEIYELDILEELLEITVGYDLRRRIRAQIRLVKNLISEDKLKIINLKTTKVGAPTRDVPETKVYAKKSPTRDIPETRTYSRKSSDSNFTEYQAKYIRKSSADNRVINNHLYDHTNLVDQKDMTDKATEYQTSYSRKSSTTKTDGNTESKPNTRNKSPVKSRETSPETKLCRREKSPEKTTKATSKYFQTELKKVSTSTKSTKDDKPDWVTNRPLRKITTTSSPVTKQFSSSTTKTSVTKEVKTSSGKPTDVITSSYGVGPMDEYGSPLFGLKALRTQNTNDQSKVQGTVIRSEYYSQNGQEPVGEVSVTKYSTDPADLSSDEEITKTDGLLSKTTTQKFGYKGTPSYKAVANKKQLSEIENENRTKKSTTKITRRGSVKEMTQKFLDNTVDSLKSERHTYPKAGLILRTSSFKDDSTIDASPAEERSTSSTVTTVRTSTSKTTSGGGQTATQKGQTFLTNKSKVTGMQDIVSRMQDSNKVTEEGDTLEDTEARSLLNKFLGSQVILSGIEGCSTKAVNKANVSRKATTKITTTITEGGKPRTITRVFTHPISAQDIADITDEETLRLLLDQSSEYDERRILRAKLKEIMADKEESFEPSKQSFTEGPPVTTTQVSTTKFLCQQQVSKKPMSPFAKFKQLDRANSLNTPPTTPKTPGGTTGGGPMFKFTDPQLSRSASTIKERLLQWCQMKTKEYENIKLDNFSGSWADGLAFCALVHHFLPDAFDYTKLTPNNRRYNFTLAFQIADEKADIAPLLDVEDMVATRRPDWKCVFTYVQSIYRRFKDED